MKHPLLYAPGALLLTLAAGLSFWYYHQLAQLNAQLAYSATVLTTENQQAAKRAKYAVYGIRAAVEKNRNQPADMARLHRAEALHTQVTTLLASLHACDSLVRRLAGGSTNASSMQQLAYQPFSDVTGPVARRWQKLRRQLTTCNDSLRQISPSDPLPALLHEGTATTVAQTLADLAITEQQLLRNEASALNFIGKTLAHRKLLFKPLALAIAQRNIVAPGDTYRARLLLATHLPADAHQMMSCNGQPVPVDSLGIGQVRFRAPLQAGLASWTGTIRLNQNGRDTTFVVRVPYRVAHR